MYAKHASAGRALTMQDREHLGARTPWLLGGRMEQAGRRVTGSHAHESGQIFGVERGVMRVRTTNACRLVGPGQVLWLPPRMLHEARSHGAIAGWSLYVTGDRSAVLPAMPFLAGASWLLGAQADRLSRGWAYDSRTVRLAECFWDEFLAMPRQSGALPLPRDVRLCRVTDALSDDPGDRRDQLAWASLAGMSLRSFIRHFVGETGMPFSRWRQRLRILAAQEGLARGESVTDVAFSVGYDSVGAFAGAFRTITGYRPGDYARLCVPVEQS